MNRSLRSSSRRSRRKPRREFLGGVALLLVSLLLTLFALEIAIRVWRGTLGDWSNAVVEARRPDKVDGGLAADRTLGSVPTPGFTREFYHHDADGFRLQPPMSRGGDGPPAVLAIGDSFTYGLEVGDGETWPATLQGLLGARVVNAGVPGYGIDQDVLRAEQLGAALKPRAIVLSFIADNVRRMERRRAWGREKPYFELTGDTLALRNVPVPPNPAPGSNVPAFERWFGWSALVELVRMRLVADQEEYFGDHVRALPSGGGELLVCPLMKRLAQVGVPLLVVAQYDPNSWDDKAYGANVRRLSAEVLRCADAAGLGTLDLFGPMDLLIKAQGRTALYEMRSDHHNAAGNRFVAERIAAELKRRNLP